MAGGIPILRRIVLEICPKAMPSAPSIICATKPIMTKGSRAAGSAKMSVRMTVLRPVILPLTAGDGAVRQARPAREKGRPAFHYAPDSLNWGQLIEDIRLASTLFEYLDSVKARD